MGFPGGTAQKPQRRVHRSPRIITVAVPRAQQWPRLGQCASSQTVWRFWRRSSALVSAYSPEPGSRTLSHSGSRRKPPPSAAAAASPTPAPEAHPP